MKFYFCRIHSMRQNKPYRNWISCSFLHDQLCQILIVATFSCILFLSYLRLVLAYVVLTKSITRALRATKSINYGHTEFNVRVGQVFSHTALRFPDYKKKWECFVHLVNNFEDNEVFWNNGRAMQCRSPN